jgi:hypothetical protein
MLGLRESSNSPMLHHLTPSAAHPASYATDIFDLALVNALILSSSTAKLKLIPLV